MVSDNIEVTVCCMVYNQACYVEKMLDGIVMQKTTFKYRALIHDDASTDGTVEILKKYKEKYPDIIELILEEENQYSKGVKMIKNIVYPRVKGKYMALCEGDDFWIYDGKLQVQYEFMESHPEVSLCYHNALIYQEDTDELVLNVLNQVSGYIEDKDVICTTKGWYPTASAFFRTAYYAGQPDFPIATSDEGMRTCMACRGKLYFMNRAWSVYRQLAKGSWNVKCTNDKLIFQNYIKNLTDYFIRFNEYSSGRFEKYIYERMRRSLMYYIEVHCAKLYTMDEFRTYIEELKTLTEHKADAFLEKLYSIEAINCTDYYPVTMKEKVQSLVRKDTSLYIYGAGTESLKALVSLYKYNIDIKGFIVTKKASGNKLLGYPIFELSEMKWDENVVVWPCFVKEREAVIRMLSEINTCGAVIVQ